MENRFTYSKKIYLLYYYREGIYLLSFHLQFGQIKGGDRLHPKAYGNYSFLSESRSRGLKMVLNGR